MPPINAPLMHPLASDTDGTRSLSLPSLICARVLVSSEYLGDVLGDTLSAGVPLWDGRSPRTVRAATGEEDLKWLAEHYRNNTELGFSDDQDQGMGVWIVPVDGLGNLPPQFSCKDEWGFG
jgi:hypothetical protein